MLTYWPWTATCFRSGPSVGGTLRTKRVERMKRNSEVKLAICRPTPPDLESLPSCTGSFSQICEAPKVEYFKATPFRQAGCRIH